MLLLLVVSLTVLPLAAAADVIYELKRCSDGHMYLREEKKKVSMIELGMEILGIPEIISGGDFFFYSADTAKNAGSIGRGGREANFGRASMLTYVELQDFEKDIYNGIKQRMNNNDSKVFKL